MEFQEGFRRKIGWKRTLEPGYRGDYKDNHHDISSGSAIM